MIDAALIEVLADEIERHGLDERVIGALRRAHPDLHFTVCSDNDIPARLPPAVTRSAFNIYLIDRSGHCVKFTSEPEQASGLVCAMVD